MDNPLLLFLFSCFGIFITGVVSQYSGGTSMGGYGGSAQGGYGGGGGGGYGGGSTGGGYGGSYDNSYGQGSGIYFKKPVPIDEKPIFFRTPYWLPNMYYGHYGYPWTQWFDGGPRFVVPIMRAYPHGGGHTQNYDTGYGVPGVGQAGYSGTTAAPAYGSYGGGSSYGGGGDDTSGTTTVDPLNDGFSFYKGIPIYQTYYEKYLLQKAQASTAAPSS